MYCWQAKNSISNTHYTNYTKRIKLLRYSLQYCEKMRKNEIPSIAILYQDILTALSLTSSAASSHGGTEFSIRLNHLKLAATDLFNLECHLIETERNWGKLHDGDIVQEDLDPSHTKESCEFSTLLCLHLIIVKIYKNPKTLLKETTG